MSNIILLLFRFDIFLNPVLATLHFPAGCNETIYWKGLYEVKILSQTETKYEPNINCKLMVRELNFTFFSSFQCLNYYSYCESSEVLCRNLISQWHGTSHWCKTFTEKQANGRVKSDPYVRRKQHLREKSHVRVYLFFLFLIDFIVRQYIQCFFCDP